jgi:hypothetical protein
MRAFVTKLGRFNYTIHNFIAHPIMEILHLIGLSELGDKVHDKTLPFRLEQEPPQAEDNQVQELEQELAMLKGKYMDNLRELDPHREAHRLYSEWLDCMGVELPYTWNSPIENVAQELQDKVSEFKSSNRERQHELREEFKRKLS